MNLANERERERERDSGRVGARETETETETEREIETERQRQRQLIAVERKSRNLTLESLLNDNCNTQNLLSGFNIKEELLMALSEKKSQHPRRKRYVIFCGESYSSIDNQLEILKEGIEKFF